MASINRRDSALRGRGYSIKLSGANSSAGSIHGSQKQSLLGGALMGVDDLLVDGADDENLLQDFEKGYSDNLLLDFDFTAMDD